MMAKKTTSRTHTGTAAHRRPAPAGTPRGRTASVDSAGGLRVRMFRVGFGDFFLLSIPASPTAKHILIDCGVHAKDVKSIRDAVTQMAKDCNSHLSLIIMTHRHADHISGFGTCSDIFSGITVDRVWMPWFEDCKNNDAKAIQAGFTTLATQLTARLAARSGAASEQLARMVENITGGIDTMGIAANQKALDVLHGGFKNKPEHDYYHAGDTAKLPDDLVAAGLTAQILGPPSDPALIKQMTNKAQQYLAGDRDSDSAAIAPFAAAFRAGEKDYPPSAFRFHTAKEITAILKDSQPDMLEAQALAADNTLNNQSLVVFFSFAGKNLLFAGDAQWGNWEHFLYGGAYGTSGHTAITSEAKAILGAIDFYKVGHHGSANATPKDAVAAMRLGCVGMCSTAIEAYNEVPREPLLTALRGRMNGQLARSDQVPAGNATANSKAGVLQLPFVAPTKSLFIDYNF